MGLQLRYRSCVVLGAMAFLLGACSDQSPDRERKDAKGRKEEPVDQVKLAVVNKGPETLYEVKVFLGFDVYDFRGISPHITASRKFTPRPDQLGQRVTVLIEYENEEGDVTRLQGVKPFEMFPKGEVRVEIGSGKLLAETITRE